MRWTHKKPTKPGPYWMRDRRFIGSRDEIVEIFYVNGSTALTIHYLDTSRPLENVGNGPSVLWSDIPIPKPMDEPPVNRIEMGKGAKLRAKIQSTNAGSWFDVDESSQLIRRSAKQVGARVQTHKIDGCGFRVVVLSKTF